MFLSTYGASKIDRCYMLAVDQGVVTIAFMGGNGDDPRISLTDGMGQTFELQTISNEKYVGLYHVFGYDMSGVNPPFEPNSLRLEGNGSRSPWAGATLFNIKARISK